MLHFYISIYRIGIRKFLLFCDLAEWVYGVYMGMCKYCVPCDEVLCKFYSGQYPYTLPVYFFKIVGFNHEKALLCSQFRECALLNPERDRFPVKTIFGR